MTVAVVGLGLIGSGALAHLARSGTAVLGIGPGEPADLASHPGAFASHYDSGRITRHLDPRAEWAVLAARAIAGYHQLEVESGIAFHRPTGAVMAELDPARVERIVANAARLGVACTRTAPGDPAPHGTLLSFPEGSTVLGEGPPAGHVDPRRMAAANLGVAVGRGAAIDRSEATSIGPTGDGRWAITSGSGATVVADRVVVAAGPHTDEVLDAVGAVGDVRRPVLEPRGEAVVLATLDAAEAGRLAELPAVLARVRHPRYVDLYLVPPTTYPDGTVRLKLGATLAQHRRLPTAAAKRAWMRGDQHREELDDLRSLLLGLVPGLAVEAWETKPCLITETPSDLPYIDHVAPGLVVAAGGNGYAAKSANAIGALAADLAVAGRWTDPELDAASFAVPR